MSQDKKILKTKVLKEITGTTAEGYAEYSLPSSMYQLKSIIALNEENEIVSADFHILGKKKIYISNKSDAQYILEYFAYPTVITEETTDDFSLELDQDVQFVLPYAVANDLLKSDPSSDYTAFLSEYKRKLEKLDTRIKTPTITIKEGVL